MTLAEEVATRGTTRAAVDLSALVRESLTADAAREVLQLRFDSLPPALRRPQQRHQLRQALLAALGAVRAQIFDLPNGDIVTVARPPGTVLDGAEAALRDALPDAAAPAVSRLRLPEDAARLLTTVAESLGLEPGEAPPPAPFPPTGLPLDSAALAAAEAALAAADLEGVTTAQAVCRIDPDSGIPEPLWQDRRIAWPALTALLLPGRDLDAAPGLARRLARVAEARLLAEFARPVAQRLWRPIGLPLAPATLEGPAFTRFADALPAGRHGETTVAIRPADVLADPGLPARLRPSLAARGFRFALDDAAPGLFALVPPARLGVDVIRLRWSPALPGAEPPALAALLAGGAERVVLTGVDRPAAIAWGWEAGLRLFQGPLVERRRGGV
ncbi:MAG: hypothetical protein O9325_11925 [Roseomonas sp.]|nr:hypothetical protein [Roseomonas sp.]